MRVQIAGPTLLAALFLCSSSLYSQSKPELGPIQAELFTRLNVRHLTNGASVFARVTSDWTGDDCFLKSGAILEGKVESVTQQGRGRRGSKLALAFDKAQCNGSDTTPFELVLGAVAGPPGNWINRPDLGSLPSSFSNPTGGSLPGTSLNGIGDFGTTHLEFMGFTHKFPMRPNLQPGDVLDIKGLKLEVGTGPNRSSVLTAHDRDIVLDAYTQLLLVPASLAFRPSGARLTAGGAAVVPRPRPAPAPELPTNFEACAPPGCAIDLPDTAKELTGSASTSIPIGPLGYTLRSQRAIADLDDEQALAWLGPQQLLVTFNPHTLIKRSASTALGAPVRLIRAVLFDTSTRRILLAVDWEVPDWNRFLWQLEGNRILVHVGSALRIYATGLKLESSIPLAGPLAFVRVSPNGELMAIGTLSERHTPALHSRLRDAAGEEPEEDVEALILDKSLKTIGQASTVSNLLPPTLLNEGQAKLLAQPQMRYRLVMNTWDNKIVTLARFDSDCKPELSSFAPDLLFLVTCDNPSGNKEYRVLRPDGKQLLKGTSGVQDLGHEAIGSAQNGRFALKVIHARRAVSSGQEFRGDDLDSEKVRIYRAADGRRLFEVQVDQPVSSHLSYALSPDGSQLAVLAGSEIRFFALPPRD